MISDNFLDYLKKVENGNKAGWHVSKQVWYPHASPEGGNDTSVTTNGPFLVLIEKLGFTS